MVNEAGIPFEYWKGGKAIDAGKLIFEALPNTLRPRWASRILRLLLVKSGTNSSLFHLVMLTAEQPSKWSHGHQVFQRSEPRCLYWMDWNAKTSDLKRRGYFTPYFVLPSWS